MTTDLQAGSNIGGYILDSYVGGGSFGAVWRGHAAQGGQQVAVKLLTGALSSTETAAMRADVELLAASAASRSTHVVHVLDGGVEPVPHIVMEYIQGSDLSELLKEKGKLSASQTIDVGEAISDALAALNEAGIIHRDIKPANVMMTNDGDIKLADFGIAKIVGYETVTMAGQTAMTMAYAAPEIWDEAGVFGRPSHKSDLYAMGVLLYQCLTGETPFRGNYGALYKAHTERAPDTRVLPPETPPALRNLIERCLEKKQEDRPTDASQCIEILERARTETLGAAATVEPRQFGPWIKDEPHPTQPWAWYAHHETTNARATVEMHFTDSIEYGSQLHRAVQASARLAPLGAERLIETSRLMLHPNEAWADAPASRFQFWLAREDKQVAPATSISAPAIVSTVFALSSLLDAAAEERVVIGLKDNATVITNGELYVRRAGVAAPFADRDFEAMQLIQSLPLDAEASRIVNAARDFPALVRSLSADSTIDRALITACIEDERGRGGSSDTVVVFRESLPSQLAEAGSPARRTPSISFQPPVRVDMQLARRTAKRTAAWYDLTLHNEGVLPVKLNLSAADPRNKLTYSLPNLVTLAANSSEHVRVHVKSHRRGFLGGTRHTSFTITASGEGNGNEPPMTISGEFEDHPSMFAGAGILGLAAIAIATTVYGATEKKHHDSKPTTAAHLAPAKVDQPALPVPVAIVPSPVAPAPEAQAQTEAPAAAPAPSEEPAPVEPAYVAPAAPTPEANRANCNAIRGTSYLSGTEAAWYRANCSAPAPSGNTSTGSTTSTVSAPAQKTSSLVGLSMTGGNGSVHHVGEQLTLCYSSKANQRIRVYDTSTPGTLMRSGVDDGKGECFGVTVTLPAGSDSVRIDALNGNGQVVDYAQISIIVVQ